MITVDSIRGGAEPVRGHPALEVTGKNRSSRVMSTFVGTSGQESSGHGSFHSAL